MRTLDAASTARGLVWFGWTLLVPHLGAAQELPCRHDLDCPDFMVCESFTYTVCSGPNDGDCHEETPNRCFPTFTRPCENDADCGPNFVCGTQTRPICGDLGGTGGSGATALVVAGSGGAPAKCHEATEHICMLTHTPCTQASDCAAGFDCAVDPYCPPFRQPPSNVGTGGSFAAGGSGGGYEPFDAGPPRDCERICAPPSDPFVPPYTGGGGGPGDIDEDGGLGAGGSVGSKPVASGTGGRNPLDYCGNVGSVVGGGAMGSGGAWGGSGGSGSLASGTGGSGASDTSSDSAQGGAGHFGYTNGLGCAVSNGHAPGSWLGLVGLLGVGLRLRARRRDR